VVETNELVEVSEIDEFEKAYFEEFDKVMQKD
jgi:hypothetical protein